MEISADQVIQLLHQAGVIPGKGSAEDVERYERAIRQYLIPSIANLVNQPLTLQTMLELKERYIQSDIQARCDKVSEQEAEKLRNKGEIVLKEYLTLMQHLVNLTHSRSDVDPLDIFRQMELSQENLIALEAGTLTVGELLMSQPEIFLEGP